jgi:hypothetical protein
MPVAVTEATNQPRKTNLIFSILRSLGGHVNRPSSAAVEVQLVHLYAERGSPKYERAAMRWPERYLAEGSPRLQHFAEIATELARHELEAGGRN